jgi:Holliday junction DNA helicase RuvB
LEDVVEPYLLRIGFLRRTKRVREVTKQACEHLGLKFHKKKRNSEQPELFEESD